MTHDEWLGCDDAAVLLDFASRIVGDRRLRLILCGLCRLRRLSGVCLEAVDCAEDFAGGEASLDALEECRRMIYLNSVEQGGRAVLRAMQDAMCMGSDFLNNTGIWTDSEVIPVIRDVVGDPWDPHVVIGVGTYYWDGLGGEFFEERRASGSIISPEWLTPSVRGIAERAYRGRDFAALPVLVDALEDAGCFNEKLLAHLREQFHVRGCWALDLVRRL